MMRNLVALATLTLALALQHGSAAEFMPPKRTDKCPVCGMFVYKYPSWVAEIIFRDNSYAVFDGTKDMLKYYFDMPRYNAPKDRDDIAAIYVTEYYSNRIMRAEDLFYVLGSDVLGPMGHELIPVKGQQAAQTFLSEHGGDRMLRFDEITPADIPE